MNVCVYSETGSFMLNKTGNLVGYTSNTVTMKQGGTTYVHLVNLGKSSSLNEHS